MSPKCSCGSKIMKFDCRLTIVDFLTNTVDFRPPDQLTEQFVIQDLKLDGGNLEGP